MEKTNLSKHEIVINALLGMVCEDTLQEYLNIDEEVFDKMYWGANGAICGLLSACQIHQKEVFKTESTLSGIEKRHQDFINAINYKWYS